VRSRQSTLYRAQRLAEYTLYDGDPTLLNTELERYLAVTPEEIRAAVKRYLLTENHSVIDVVPAHAAGGEDPAPAEPEPPGEPEQPGAPPPQVPTPPPAEPPPPTGHAPHTAPEAAAAPQDSPANE
jgi:hypothetical protein